MKALITDADERVALATTRSLGRRVEVHVVGPERTSLAGRSRYAAAHHRVRAPFTDVREFVAGVMEVVSKHAIDVVIPTTDAACQALIPARERLPPACLLAPEFEPYRRASDKGEVARLAPRFGLAVPEGFQASTLDETLARAESLGWPVVMRAVESVASEGTGLRKRGAARVADAKELSAAWPGIGEQSRVLVQRPVDGRGEGIFVLRTGGRTKAAFAHARLREKPPSGGVSVLRESMEIDADRLRGVERLLDELGYEGVAMAEFKNDGRTAWLIELNARLWGSLQLAVDAGMDFPRLLLGEDVVAPSEGAASYRIGVRSRWLLGDLDHAIALARGAVDASGRTGLGAALRAVFVPAGPDCHWEILRFDDPRPFGTELRRWVQQVIG